MADTGPIRQPAAKIGMELIGMLTRQRTSTVCISIFMGDDRTSAEEQDPGPSESWQRAVIGQYDQGPLARDREPDNNRRQHRFSRDTPEERLQ
jgi:hypothetical protein